MPITIAGFDSSVRVPIFAAQVVFGAGALSSGAQPLVCLLVGLKTSAGSASSYDIVSITTEDEADTYFGPGSQLARMCYKALRKTGVTIQAMAIPEAGGATAATVTLLLGGTWTTAGTFELWIAGERVATGVTTSMAVDDVGAAVAAAVNANTKLPFTAAYNTGTDTITLTCKNLGAHGLDWLVYLNRALLPTGLTCTMTGSATQGTDRVRAGAGGTGTGTEDVTTGLTKLLSTRYARIGSGQYDATNAALWETHVNAKAAATVDLFDQVNFGVNGTWAAAKSLGQTTLNAQRAHLAWQRNSESHPAEIAAALAALRAVTELDSPVPDYDGVVLDGIAPARYPDDVPSFTEQNTALQNSVIPISTADGSARIVRGITTYSLLGGTTADDRTLDTGDASFPDYAALRLQALYNGSFRPANPYVQADPDPTAKEPPSGVATPKRWNVEVQKEEEDWFANNWIEDPAAYPPVSEYNKTARRIMSNVTFVVRRVQHGIGVVVRQTAG